MDTVATSIPPTIYTLPSHPQPSSPIVLNSLSCLLDLFSLSLFRFYHRSSHVIAASIPLLLLLVFIREAPRLLISSEMASIDCVIYEADVPFRS